MNTSESENKRTAQRIEKQYTTMFYNKNHPKQLLDVARVLNISRLGLKCYACENHPKGDILVFQIRFPFLSPAVTEIEAEVLESDSILKDKNWILRVKFINLSDFAEGALNRMESFNNIQ